MIKVLLVDKNMNNCKNIINNCYTKSLNCRIVSIAHNKNEALTLINHNNFDVFLIGESISLNSCKSLIHKIIEQNNKKFEKSFIVFTTSNNIRFNPIEKEYILSIFHEAINIKKLSQSIQYYRVKL